MKKHFTPFILLFAFCLLNYTYAQDMFGIVNSNYAGLNGVQFNPSSIVDSRLGLDINLITVAVTADNNYLYMPKDKIGFFGFGKIVDNTKHKGTGYTDAKNYPGDYFTGTDNKNAAIAVLARGPSVMFHIAKNWFALCFNMRSGVSIADMSFTGAKVAYEDKGLHYAPLQNRVLNSGAFSIGTMVWSEIGFTYGREIINKDKNYLKGAITFKYLSGFAAAYIKTPGFNYMVEGDTVASIPDTMHFYNATVDYGHSYLDNMKGKSYSDLINGHGWGFDIGFTYEYRPDYASHKYEMDGKMVDNPLENKYKWKVGASLIDLGSINFDQNAETFHLTGNDARWIGWDNVHFSSTKDFDTTMSNAFYNLGQPGKGNLSNTGKRNFDMALPHAFSMQFDYNVTKYIYANASWIQRIKTETPGVVATNNIAFTPRFEKSWIDVAVPMSYYDWSQFRLGLALRLGSFIIGSDKFGSLLGVADLGGMDVYTSLKFSIGRSKIKDRDGDGVSDKMDKCPDQKGTWATLGCPDTDGDGIIDSEDECPTIPGIAKFHGCPDTDGDGIPDKDDDCPTVPGLAQFRGCPDTDGDGIPDPQDSCPTVAGLPQFHGCPDTDGDGIPDAQDSCPTVKGLPQFHGCPDTDGDGIPDPQDSCPLVPGPASNHGCPIVEKVEPKKEVAPVKATLTKEEEEVINKVFKNLEFETGKAVIRQSSYEALNELVNLLKKKTSFKLLIDGHTDNVGGAAYNMKLSTNRANAVKLYLTDKGIDGGRITAKGYGLTKPIASNKTPEGRQKNRRVEFTILD